MPVWISTYDLSFPKPEFHADSEGLVAMGGDLRPERLLEAYKNGIFPWFSRAEVPFWFSPDPRCVLFPADLKVAKSMRSTFNQHKFDYSLDTCFLKVMENCRDIWRRGDELHDHSWITDDFIAGYGALYEIGLAHSVEVWQAGQLVGGLYGVALGRVFYGESMFSLMPNASKAGFIRLVQSLAERNFQLIDCQVKTDHLLSLGAKNIPRAHFLELLKQNAFAPTLRGNWTDWWR